MHIVRSGGLEGFPQLVKSMGCSPSKLLGLVKLDPSVIRQPDTYLPYAKVAELLKISAEHCGDELFGLKLSALQGRRTLGSLGLFISHQPTIGQGLETARRFVRFHASGVSLKRVDMGSFTQFELGFSLSESIGLDQLRLLSVGLLNRIFQRLTGDPWKPRKVFFRQPEPTAGPGGMEEFFGCPVSCGAGLDGLVIDNRVLVQRPSASAEQTRGYLEEHIRSMEAEFPDNIVEQVRHTVGSLLPISECNLENVAKLLDLHPRMLQLKLSARGTGFQQLVDEMRLNIAKEYLRHTKTSLTDLALNLGFAELAIFSRAFKRWTGVSPSAWRKRELKL